MGRTTIRLFRVHCSAYFKEKFLLLSALRPLLGGDDRGDSAEAPERDADEPDRPRPRRRRGGIPSHYRPPPGVQITEVIDTEGPLRTLQRFAQTTTDLDALHRWENRGH